MAYLHPSGATFRVGHDPNVIRTKFKVVDLFGIFLIKSGQKHSTYLMMSTVLMDMVHVIVEFSYLPGIVLIKFNSKEPSPNTFDFDSISSLDKGSNS